MEDWTRYRLMGFITGLNHSDQLMPVKENTFVPTPCNSIPRISKGISIRVYQKESYIRMFTMVFIMVAPDQKRSPACW